MNKNKRRIYVDYYDLSEQFSQIYLEDSYVESIIEGPNRIEFLMELVIRENHPKYEPPRLNEQYCYVYGKVVFPELKNVLWYEKDFKPSIDALGKMDIGNIDTFIYCLEDTYFDYKQAEIGPSLPQEFTYLAGERRPIPQGYYYVSGDWGAVAIQSDKPFIEIYDKEKIV